MSIATPSDINWGLCVSCRLWQIEPKAIATHQTAGLCLAASLRSFRLRVTGNSGCSEFEPGPTSRGEGSSLKPPPEMIAESSAPAEEPNDGSSSGSVM